VHLPEVSTSLENNALNHIVEEVLAFETSFIGKNIDRSDNFHFAMEDIPIPVCLYEEGLAETAPLLPWQRSIVGPSKLPTIEDLSEPPDSLELSYIYGFSVEISRQSLIYANDGDALFIAAAVVVKMNPVSRKQRFYTEHTCTVTALASQTDSSIVASGQRGEIPSIRIWDSSSFTTLIVISGFHRRAINHLQFSQDGKLLLAVGMDEMHSIGVYDWKNSLLLASSNGITNKSLAVSFFPSGTSLIQCGNEVIRFWDIEGINLKGQDAVLGGKAVIQGFLCIGWVGNTPVVGTCDGHLYRFIGRQLDGIIKAHEGPIFAIASHSNGICTCSSDGTIKSWARILECTHTISIKDLKSTSLDIRCLNWHPDGRVLFGTAVGDIFEIASDGRNIHRVALSEGHGGQELCGISMHPTLDLFATTGDDALLRVWDYVSHMATKTVRLEMPSRCCAFSPDGRKIAVGFGAPNNAATTKKFDGKWVLLETDDYQLVHEGRDSLKYLTDMKYSPNGEILAIGSSDNRIYLYNMFANNTLIATLGQHRSFITALDFSMDSGWLQSNCGGYDLNFYEADTGMYIPNATRMRDIQWASQTCTMGWSVQGLWTPFRDGSECTAADCNFSRRDDGVVVAGGDNFGRITLARHPCYESKAISKRYRYSSNPINRLRFTPNDAFLMAVSGADKIVMQFVHHREVSENLATDAIHREDNAEEGKDEVLSLMGLKSSAAADAVDAKVQIGGRTWIAYAIAPTAPPELITTKPALDIDMSHIIGLQNEMIRTNICLNADGDIISPTSKYICLFNKQSNLQVHYDQHLSTICCVAVSGDHALVASAERCSRPLIHVWSADTCQQIVKLPLLHRGGVGSIQFSADRRFILSVGLDDDRTIALWFSPSANWLDGHLSAWGKGDVQSVMFASFYSFGTTVAASGGSCHIKFWGVDGHCLNPTYAEYPHTVKLGLLTCGAQVGQLFITGSASGQLFVWKGHAYDRTIRAHDAYITGIFSEPSGSSILTISKDGIVHQWSKALEHMKNFSAVDADVAPIMKGLLSVDACLSSDGSSLMKVAVTTQSSEIYEVAAKSGNCFLLSEAHYFGELWGLAAHPTKPDVFATVGDDKTLR
jgi:microtubule-associated protein-like 6